MNNKIGLIDMDIPAHAVAAACEGKYWTYRGREYESKSELNIILDADGIDKDKRESVVTAGSRPEDWSDVRKSLVSYVEDVLDPFIDYKGFLSGKGNFRYKVATILPYKGNRDPLSRPHHLDNCRQFLVDTYEAEVTRGMEADDSIGLASGEDTVVVTLDKDLDCIPGLHRNWVKDKDYEVSEIDSYRNFFKQMMTGDTTDNILGLYGVGPKAAMVKKVDKMDTVEEMVDLVNFEYSRRFGQYAKDFLEETAQLIWILQGRRNPLVSGEYWV